MAQRYHFSQHFSYTALKNSNLTPLPLQQLFEYCRELLIQKYFFQQIFICNLNHLDLILQPKININFMIPGKKGKMLLKNNIENAVMILIIENVGTVKLYLFLLNQENPAVFFTYFVFERTSQDVLGWQCRFSQKSEVCRFRKNILIFTPQL